MKKLVSEGLGTALLVAIVVGSGMMAEKLCGNVGLALLANTLATAAGLIALILTFGPISGAHFNPVVSVAAAVRGELGWREASLFIPAQIAGGIAGTIIAHAMFGHALVAASHHVRSGGAQIFSEAVATFGLCAVIWGGARKRDAVPYAVGLWIAAAYWFTASTSFANPAVTIARALTDTFAGIRPADVPGFLLGQALGGGAAVALFSWLA